MNSEKLQHNKLISRLVNLKIKVLSAVKNISRLWKLYSVINLKPVIDYQELKDVSRLVSRWMGEDSPKYSDISTPVIDRFEAIEKHRGWKEAVRELKAGKLCFTRWMAGKPLSGRVGCPIDRQGLPKCLDLNTRKSLISRDDPDLLKKVLTAFSFVRKIKGGLPVNLEAIESPWTGIDPFSDSEIILGLKQLGLKVNQEPPEGVDYRFMTTAGPNGPSVTTSLWDLPTAATVFESPLLIVNSLLCDFMETLLEWSEKADLQELLGLKRNKTRYLRKVSVKPDREGKSRIFAILDYWSQTALTPLHDMLYRHLDSIPEDCTTDQTSGVEKMLAYRNNKWFYSYDLTSATDRFPVKVQERILGRMFNTSYAKAWTQLLTNEPFWFKDIGRSVKWSVGQPLGAKSSWAMFTLSHHLVVRIAAMRQNVSAEYVILGDDIVIKGYRLAQEYRRLMKLMGVEISEPKSHASPHSFEFAKIWTRKGLNVSGFPLVALWETMHKPIEFSAVLLFELPKKGFYYHLCPRSLAGFLEPITQLWPSMPRYAFYRANQVMWFITFLSWLSTASSEWARLLVQLAGVHASSAGCQVLLIEIVKRKWVSLVRKGLADLRKFAWDLAKKIPAKLASIEREEDDDDDYVPGSKHPNVLQLADHLLIVPILGALRNESELQYDAFLDGDFLRPVKVLSLSDLEKLKLPPRPQMKGFEPVRQKSHVRVLTLLTKEINSEINKFFLQPPKVSKQRKTGKTWRARR
jgi:hypothetical protein